MYNLRRERTPTKLHWSQPSPKTPDEKGTQGGKEEKEGKSNLRWDKEIHYGCWCGLHKEEHSFHGMTTSFVIVCDDLCSISSNIWSTTSAARSRFFS
eukprot:m.18972 g.18972  ORF g.18972 m.18972 type:complete len:97 (-) comp8379_c1_seq2:12-302(-)